MKMERNWANSGGANAARRISGYCRKTNLKIAKRINEMGTIKEKYIVVLVTAPSKKEANTLAECLVNERVAACINIINGIDSIFRWKGKLEKSRESILIIKTRERLFPRIEQVVKRCSSYELPEVLALPVEVGKTDYLRWIKSTTARISLD